MNYKQNIKYFFGYILLLVSLIYVYVNIIIDPYYEISQNRYFFNEKHSESIYSTNILADKLEKEKYNLVFGTSRSHKIGSETFSGKKILNFHALYGNTLSILNFLRGLNDKQISNIENIYMLIDFHSFNNNSRHKDIIYSKYVNYVYSVTNLDYYKFYISAVYMIKNIFNHNFKYYVNDYGVLINDKNQYKYRLLYSKEYISTNDKYIKSLKRIVEFTKNKNKNIIFVTPTITKKRYDELFQYREVICNTRKNVLEIVHEMYDLTLVDTVSYNNKYFTDPDHLSSKGTFKILEFLERGHGMVNDSKHLFFCKE